MMVSSFPCNHQESNMAGRSAVTAGAKGRLIAVIGDEDTCTGFLLGGIGEINAKRQKNFFVVSKVEYKSPSANVVQMITNKHLTFLFTETSVSEIEEKFHELVTRKDIAILLINQNIAEEIRHVLDGYESAIPAVLEIPSKEHPYDPSKDSILRRAKVHLYEYFCWCLC
ncbi:hypothetical protein QZH41_010748 [Actinostola sp. cb2023]|nr:hypothetical protein QZH41_010748 [Actinostola sp. cb2023]